MTESLVTLLDEGELQGLMNTKTDEGGGGYHSCYLIRGAVGHDVRRGEASGDIAIGAPPHRQGHGGRHNQLMDEWRMECNVPDLKSAGVSGELLGAFELNY